MTEVIFRSLSRTAFGYTSFFKSLPFIIYYINTHFKEVTMKDELISKLPFWEVLTTDEKEYIKNCYVTKEYKKGTYIHCGAFECLGPSIILSGEVRVCLLSEEGREITLYRLHPGDFSILSAACIIDKITFDTHMIAQTDCTLLTVLPGAFKKLTETNLNVKCYTYELATERFSSVVWTMQNIIFKGFDKRLAEFLVSEYERTGSIEIKLTHEAIAGYISSAREVVARMVKRFSEEGFIEQKRGSIKLLDIEALRRF